MSSKPKKFKFEIGGYNAASFKFELMEGDLFHDKGFSSSFFDGDEPCNLSEEDWEHLKKVLDEIEVWNWAEYYRSDVADGTQWSLEIKWDGKKAKSGGNNAYPHPDDVNKGSTDSKTVPFEKLVETLIEITGKEFY